MIAYRIVALTFIAVLFVCGDGVLAHQARPKHDLIDIKKVNPSIQVNLYFSTPDVITKRTFLNHDTPAYFRGEVTVALSKVQHELELQGLGLLIVDAYKPNALHKDIWRSYAGLENTTDSHQFIRHTGGMAVDLLLINVADNSIICPPFVYAGDAMALGEKPTECTTDDQTKYETLNTVMRKYGFVGNAPHFDFTLTKHICHPLEISFSELS